MKGRGITTGWCLVIAALAALFFLCPAQSLAEDGPNVALGKAVSASTNSYDGTPSLIVDGVTQGSTWWSYQFGVLPQEQGFVLDLGALYIIEKINLYPWQVWGLDVSVSADGAAYTEIYSGESSGSYSNPADYDYSGLLSLPADTPYKARYIQYHSYAYWNQYVGISEIQVFERQPPVEINLTYPVGDSPKVFTSGWTFGASCLKRLPDGATEDISGQVRWSGTGTFSPSAGSRSMPVFSAAGANTITLKVKVDGEEFSKDFAVQAVSPVGYARISDMASCPADAHGDPGDPHHVAGPIVSGSPTVAINGYPAARVGDVGVHATCSGPNTFEIVGGDNEVLIDGQPAARLHDPTKHCGGMGSILSASKGMPRKSAGSGRLTGTVTNAASAPIPNLAVWVYPNGQEPLWAETNEAGQYTVTGIEPGRARVLFSSRIRNDSGEFPTWSEGPYVAEWHNDAVAFADAGDVTISADSTATANAQLASAGSLSGRVMDGNGVGVPNLMVTAFGQSTQTVLWHWTNPTGDYEIQGLPPDSYKVLARAGGLGFADTWWGGMAENASPVPVAANQQEPGINIQLYAGGAISGRLTDLARPAAGIAVQAVDTRTNLGGIAVSGEDGQYAITGLPDGDYKVRFLGHPKGLADVWYPKSQGWDQAALVAITGAANREGVDGQLSPFDLSDAIQELQFLAGMNVPLGSYLVDKNNDGQIGLAEVIYILQRVSDSR